MREGIITKIFYGELFPIYWLLQHKKEEWHDTKIKHVLGNQNYDFEIIDHRRIIPRFIEVTEADMDYSESLRMRYLLEYGSVNALAKVSKEGTKKTGLQISVKQDAMAHSELNSRKTIMIKKAIEKKLEVMDRPNNTALLVFFDDSIAFSRDRGKKEMSEFFNSTYLLWRKKYIGFFLVGNSGKNFWEKYSQSSIDL